ncbi:hypothetical protein [Arthrobacter glacialis]|uniref:hypothetical protein n=1 Tax=Arthrobacter glacialis TaxID=1664 RepID=UPI000CD3CC8A|nr:hypothetical protein [Arthrobacter glacialis]POH57260.1 hypothetical protein CVS28_16830 [Arthrobacter glacialis]
MASLKVAKKLRIALGSLAVVLGLISLAMIWGQTAGLGLKVLVSFAAAGAFLLGIAVLVGRTRAGQLVLTSQLVLTRRLWRFAVVLFIVVAVIVVAVLPKGPGSGPIMAMVPAILGGTVAQLFEPEAAAAFTAAALSEHDGRNWWWVSLGLALVGIVLGSSAIVAAVFGNGVVVSLLEPIAALCLILAVAIWFWLRSRKRQFKAEP